MVKPGFEIGWVVALEWYAAVDWSFEDGEADTDVLWWSEGGSGVDGDGAGGSDVPSVLGEEKTAVEAFGTMGCMGMSEGLGVFIFVD